MHAIYRVHQAEYVIRILVWDTCRGPFQLKFVTSQIQPVLFVGRW